MFNQPNINSQPGPSEISKEDYAKTSTILAEMISALTNLREKTYDVLDTTYEILNILKVHPEYIDSLQSRVINAYRVFDYASTRYKLTRALSDDSILDKSIFSFCQCINALNAATDFNEYKLACDSLQSCGESVAGLISFKLDDLKARMEDLQVDIEIGPHSDGLSDLYPDRFKSMLSSSSNKKILAYKSTLKANQLSSTASDVSKLAAALRISKNLVTVFQAKQSVLVKQIQVFSEREDKEQVDKAKIALKQNTSDFLDKIKTDWTGIQQLWTVIDSPASPINDIDADTSRHLRKFLSNSLPDRTDSIAAIYRDVIRWVDTLQISIQQTKGNGGVQDKRSKWYIGNKSVVEDLSKFRAMLVKTAIDNAGSSKYATDNSIFFIFKELLEAISKLSDYLSHELALDIGQGDKRFQEGFVKAQLIWSQITTLYNAYSNSKTILTNTKQFEKDFNTFSGMYDRLSKAINDQDRFANIKHMVDFAPQLLKFGNDIQIEVSNTVAGQFDLNRLSLLQIDWSKLSSKYGEMLNLVPDGTAMQLTHILSDIPQAGRMLNKRVDTWLKTAIALIDKIIKFAVFYTKIKSLYPLTIGMRTMNTGLDQRGRSMENVKYIESMGALLSEALSGKSLSTTKTALLRQALDLFPNDREVITANKMYDLGIKGY